MIGWLMSLTLGPILQSAGIQPAGALVIRHAFVREHEDTGLAGIHTDSTDEKILHYTSRQSLQPRSFPAVPPPVWVIFVKEGGNRARLWSVLHNRGEEANDGRLRSFNLAVGEQMADLRNRLVIGWKAPRSWWLNGATGAGYPVTATSDAQSVPFRGLDGLVLSHAELQAGR